MGKSVAAEFLEERLLRGKPPMGVPCSHTQPTLLMIHSFFFSLADNLQTTHKNKRSQLLFTTWIYTQSEIYKIFLQLLWCYLWHQTSDSQKGIVLTVENSSTLSEDEVSAKCFRFVRFTGLDFSNLLHRECSNNYSGRISTALDLQRHPAVSYSCQLAHYCSLNDEGSAHNLICKLNVSC